MYAEKGKVGSTGDFSTYLTAPGAVHLYDGINLAALAMIAVARAPPRPCTVRTSRRSAMAYRARLSFTPSRRAPRRSRQGRRSAYVGPGGPTSFDAYHDSTGIFQIDTYSAAGPGEGRRATSRRAELRAPRAVSATCPIRPRSTAVTGDVSVFVESIGFGLVTAAVLAMASVGFTLQFAVTNVLNLAYGGVMIVSAYAAYEVNQRGREHLGQRARGDRRGRAAVGVPQQRHLHAVPAARRPSPIGMVIVSLGMTLILVFGTQAIAGPTNVSYSMSQGATVNHSVRSGSPVCSW